MLAASNDVPQSGFNHFLLTFRVVGAKLGGENPYDVFVVSRVDEFNANSIVSQELAFVDYCRRKVPTASATPRRRVYLLMIWKKVVSPLSVRWIISTITIDVVSMIGFLGINNVCQQTPVVGTPRRGVADWAARLNY